MDSRIKDIKVRYAHREEWDDAMAVAWKTFLKFEGPDYSEEGIRNFYNFITESTLYKMFLNGVYQLFVAETDGKIVGIISIRENHHISLLFVDEKYHRRGVGKALISYVCNYLLTELAQERITVNASPYGVGFYHRLGFRDLGPETVSDGIRYTPMEFYL